MPCCERRGVDERLERRAGLTPAARGAVERRDAEVAAADHRQDVAGVGIERDERRLQVRNAETRRGRSPRPAPPMSCSAGSDGRVHLPVRRMVAAELVAELLAQILLRVPVARVEQLPDTAGSRSRCCRAAFTSAAVMKPCARIRAST